MKNIINYLSLTIKNEPSKSCKSKHPYAKQLKTQRNSKHLRKPTKNVNFTTLFRIN